MGLGSNWRPRQPRARCWFGLPTDSDTDSDRAAIGRAPSCDWLELHVLLGVLYYSMFLLDKTMNQVGPRKLVVCNFYPVVLPCKRSPEKKIQQYSPINQLLPQLSSFIFVTTMGHPKLKIVANSKFAMIMHLRFKFDCLWGSAQSISDAHWW